jgi:hypothetical protein
MAQRKHISADIDGDSVHLIKDLGAAEKQWPDAGSLA